MVKFTYRKKSRSSRKPAARKRYVSKIHKKMPTLLGNYQITKLRYAIEFNQTISSTSGSVGYRIFNANSMFDPRTASGGHQPRGFDQLMSMFDHYCVLSSKIVVRCMGNTTVSAMKQTCMSLVLNDTSVPISSHSDIAESRRVKIAYLSPQRDQCSLSMNYSTSNFFNRGSKLSDLLADKELSGSATANPAEMAHYHINCQCVAGQDQTVEFAGYIDFVVCFHEPKLCPIS